MTIARIENGVIAELREMTLDDIPEHKRADWLPVEGEPPRIDALDQELEGPRLALDGEQVSRAWTVRQRPTRTRISAADVIDIFSDADYAAIQAAIASSLPLRRWWETLLTRVELIDLENERFVKAWSALGCVLGERRCVTLMDLLRASAIR